jgi:hypothetical protein
MKHLKTTFETLETWRRRQPRPTLWRTAVASKRRLGAVEREDGSRQEAGRSEERHAGAIAVDHAASAWRTLRRVVSGGGETGRRRCSGAVEHAVAMQARRVGSRMDTGTTAFREEGEQLFF